MSLNPENQPLVGLRIMVTRAQPPENCRLCSLLEAAGATPDRVPVIQVGPPSDLGPLKSALRRLFHFKSIVFLSGNAIDGFLDSQPVMESDLARSLAGGTWGLFAIGRATAERLARRGLPVSKAPERFDSDGVADMLLAQPECQPILIVRADRGSNILSERLHQAGFDFEELAAYHSVDVDQLPQPCLDSMARGEIDWCTATSAAIAKNMVRLFGQGLEETRIAAMSPAIANVFMEHGMGVDATAKKFDFEGLVDAIVSEVQRTPLG